MVLKKFFDDTTKRVPSWWKWKGYTVMILKSLKRLFNNGTKKGFTMIALKSLKKGSLMMVLRTFNSDATKKFSQC